MRGYHTGGKRQRGDPGERATVGDTVLANRDMVTTTVPLLSSEFPSRESVPAESRLPRLSVVAAFSVVSPAHDIAGTGQLTGCRSSKVTGCQHGTTVRPSVRLHGDILSLRGPCGIQCFAPEGGRPPSASVRDYPREGVASKRQCTGALQQAVTIQRGRPDAQRVSDDFSRIAEGDSI